MLQRAITGTIFVAVLISAIIFSPYTFVALFTIVTAVGIWEFYKLATNGDQKPQRILGITLGVYLFVANALISLGISNYKVLIPTLPLLFSIFIIELYTKAKNPFRNIAYTIVGVIYVAGPFSMLNYIAHTHFIDSYHPENLLGIFYILWASDTGAYLAGKSFGKRKLFERISPKKTWEGTLGGAVLSITVALITAKFYTQLSVFDWLVIALILVVMGNLGDLVESLYKRSKNVKDSGRILPGHGGILDRFDSLILSIPFIFSYLYLIK